MSRTYVSHVTSLIRTRDMTHLDDSVVVMSHDTHERGSRYTYARVMSHLFMNHVTRMNKDEWVTSFFFWLACLISYRAKKKTDMTDLSRDWCQQSMVHMFNEWVMSRVSHVKHMRRSCHMTVTVSYEWRDPFLIDLCCVYIGLFCVH
jgi:hypothetical protein